MAPAQGPARATLAAPIVRQTRARRERTPVSRLRRVQPKPHRPNHRAAPAPARALTRIDPPAGLGTSHSRPARLQPARLRRRNRSRPPRPPRACATATASNLQDAANLRRSGPSLSIVRAVQTPFLPHPRSAQAVSRRVSLRAKTSAPVRYVVADTSGWPSQLVRWPRSRRLYGSCSSPRFSRSCQRRSRLSVRAQ